MEEKAASIITYADKSNSDAKQINATGAVSMPSTNRGFHTIRACQEASIQIAPLSYKYGTWTSPRDPFPVAVVAIPFPTLNNQQ